MVSTIKPIAQKAVDKFEECKDSAKVLKLCEKHLPMCTEIQVGVLHQTVHGTMSLATWAGGNVPEKQSFFGLVKMLERKNEDIVGALERIRHGDMGCSPLEAGAWRKVCTQWIDLVFLERYFKLNLHFPRSIKLDLALPHTSLSDLTQYT